MLTTVRRIVAVTCGAWAKVRLTIVTFSTNAAGPNGCGKSTLLRLIMDREKPISGSVSLGQHHILPNYFEQNQVSPRSLSRFWKIALPPWVINLNTALQALGAICYRYLAAVQCVIQGHLFSAELAVRHGDVRATVSSAASAVSHHSQPDLAVNAGGCPGPGPQRAGHPGALRGHRRPAQRHQGAPGAHDVHRPGGAQEGAPLCCCFTASDYGLTAAEAAAQRCSALETPAARWQSCAQELHITSLTDIAA